MVEILPSYGKISTMFTRNITTKILEALSDTPVVFLRGARQAGKSTLVKRLAEGPRPARYVTLDNAGVFSAASSDPVGFIAGLDKPVIIDEAQRVPDLFRAIKEDVDRERVPGRYLLTGSADVLTLPQAADSLVGRMEVLTLWPLSTGELKNRGPSSSVTAFFQGDLFTSLIPDPHFDLAAILVCGGFPEPVQRTAPHRRRAWFESYITTILDRDIRDLSQIQDLAVVPKLIRFLAGRTASLHNQSEVSRSCGIPNATLSRYLALLEMTFLVHFLPAWSHNLGKRLVKTPKIFMVDSGLLCHLLGMDEDRLRRGNEAVGRIFENFVVLELLKQTSWAGEALRLYHFRSHAGQEVDVVIENGRGEVVGVEIKLSATPSPKDFSGLKMLRELLGPKFIRGLLIYTGKEIVPFGKDLHAIPVSVL
ncbi:putative ATPase (AAA+ superfamily) [uncultured Desulfatiglans sp.]|nr:putative ATPase (AAA+ superfamily) [uncultured Desulfatiglans sp.]